MKIITERHNNYHKYTNWIPLNRSPQREVRNVGDELFFQYFGTHTHSFEFDTVVGIPKNGGLYRKYD